jgi:hypothetical protein
MRLFFKAAKARRDGAADKNGGLAGQLATLNKDGRLHARYMIETDAAARVELDGGLVGVVRDISYGGVAVRFEAGSQLLPTTLPPVAIAKMHLLDRSVDCKLGLVRSMAQGSQALLAGFTIAHETTETLVFLRELIEPLRRGVSLAELGAAILNERYNGPEWSCWRGDGPTDLVLKTHGPSGSKGLAEGLLTFAADGFYCEITFKGRSVTVTRIDALPSEAAGHTRLGTRMPADAQDAERHILRHAACILMAAPESARQTARPMLEAMIARLTGSL